MNYDQPVSPDKYRDFRICRNYTLFACVSIDEQCAFYENIGFVTKAKYKAPNAYAVVEYEDITLHFWGNKKHESSHNASCVFVEVEAVDSVNASFCTNIKITTGKVPRTGFGRISEVRSLKEDRRFTLCDPAGNTIYFGTPQTDCPARTLVSSKYATIFATAYDLLHSHENPEKAAKTLPKLLALKDDLSEADKVKVDLLVAQIEDSIKLHEQKE